MPVVRDGGRNYTAETMTMETLFDWSDVPGRRGNYGHFVNEDGSIDWRLRCLHLAEAADALQLAAIGFQNSSAPQARALQAAGDTVFGHLEYIKLGLQEERWAACGEWSPTDAEVERIKPALQRIVDGLRSDNRTVTLLLAVAAALHDSAAEVGEEPSDESRYLDTLARRWERESP